MGYWIVMLFVDLLIPLTMIGFGKVFSKSAPKRTNEFFGYRTAMSMKNQDTWTFAHHYIGRRWLGWGLGILPLSVIALLPALGKPVSTVGITGLVICCAQLIPMTVPIYFTEKALKKTFDENGNRR